MKIGNLDVYGIIYKIINILNGKVYIGQTTDSRGFDGRYHYKGEGIERVFNHYQGLKNRQLPYNEHLYNSIIKYGFESFNISYVFDTAFSKEELDTKEICWISFYNSANVHYGYNYSKGGNDSLSHGTKIICLNTKVVYDSIVEAEEKEHNTGMRRHLYGISNFCGKDIKTNEKLVWEYYNTYLTMTEEEIQYKIKKGNDKTLFYRNPPNPEWSYKSVVCLTTGEIFKSITEASNKYDESMKKQLSTTLLHFEKSKTCGKHPITGEKLIWIYYKDYIDMTDDDIEEYIKIRLTVKETRKGKQIKCKTTNEIFNSIAEACKKYNLSNRLVKILQQNKRFFGKHPITNELLEWEYVF